MLRKSVIITSNSGRVSNVTVRFAHNVAPYDIAYGKPSRMANSGMTATLFGGYGFLGRYVASMLGKEIFHYDIFGGFHDHNWT